MANVARSITKANGFGNIVVINSHSTEVSVGPESEMKVIQLQIILLYLYYILIF